MKFKKSISMFLASLLLVVQLPVVALADDAPTTPPPTTTQSSDPSTTPANPDPASAPAPAPAPSDSASNGTPATQTTPPAANTPGPNTPPGPDANKYTFNAKTGLWESDKYTWNPTTKQTAPKVDPGYYYNPTTGMWDTTSYQYHPETGTYQPVTVSTSKVPTGASNTVAPADPSAAMMATLAQLFGASPSISNTGPTSTNTIDSNSSNTGIFDLFSQAAINNTLTSNAHTGDASVTGNTNGGNATTGSAQVVENLLNLLNSAWSWSTGGLSTFVQNLFGNQTGNILLQPGAATSGGGQLGTLPGTSASNSQTGPNSSNTINADSNNALDVNSQSNGTINNNGNLLAQSGNAGVSGNTNGGNATSGDAGVDLNIMNLINSAIGAGQSFFGVVNVFGNLAGNILFPQGFLDGVAATNASPAALPSGSAINSGTGPGSTNQIDANSSNTGTLNNTSTNTINNNVNSAAQSGTAGVSNNTTAGSATTGAAKTNTDTFNFAGNLVSDNAVLVLVNVLGHWVGGILNLPQTGASQAALLTGGPTTLSNSNTGPGSSNAIDTNSQNTTNVNSNSTGTINNNINAGAISGNADVSGNTKAGNATSGNAGVATNVANFVGSTLNVKHWFGVLMVNVFGDWTGSVTTATADTQKSSVQSSNSPVVATTSPSAHTTTVKSSTGTAGGTTKLAAATTQKTATSATPNNTKVLSARAAAATNQSRQLTIWILAAALLMLVSGMMITIERKLGPSS